MLLFFDKSDGSSHQYITHLKGTMKQIHYFGDIVNKVVERDFHPAIFVPGYIRMYSPAFIHDINTIIQKYYHILYGNTIIRGHLSKQNHICAIVLYETSWPFSKQHLVCYYYHERGNKVYEINVKLKKNDSDLYEKIVEIKTALRCPLPKIALYQTTGSYFDCITINNANISDAVRGDYLCYNSKHAIYIGGNNVINIENGKQNLYSNWISDAGNHGSLTIKYDVIPKYNADIMIERARKRLPFRTEIYNGEYVVKEGYIKNDKYTRNVVRKFGKYYYDDKIQSYIPTEKMSYQFMKKYYRYRITCDAMKQIRAIVTQKNNE
eukprot:178212_1